MSDADTGLTRTDATDAHDTGHEHESTGEPLGPIDVTAWAYTLAGAGVGIAVALALFVARGG